MQRTLAVDGIQHNIDGICVKYVLHTNNRRVHKIVVEHSPIIMCCSQHTEVGGDGHSLKHTKNADNPHNAEPLVLGFVAVAGSGYKKLFVSYEECMTCHCVSLCVLRIKCVIAESLVIIICLSMVHIELRKMSYAHLQTLALT